MTENGFGKRTSIDEYPLHKRGGKGVITIKTNERNGQVVCFLEVQNEDDLMLVTDGGKIIRMPVENIKAIGRNTQGVKLIGMEAGERVVSAARLADEEDDDASRTRLRFIWGFFLDSPELICEGIKIQEWCYEP